MAATPETPERVLVLLEGPAAEAALETAARLAARRGARLIALLVEDDDLLTTAGLPFAREIGLVSGVARPLSAAGLQAQLHERATHLRRLLDQLAERNAIKAELQIGRGPQARVVLTQAGPDDLLVLSRSRWAQRPGDSFERLVTEALCAVMLIGPRAYRSAQGPMVVLDGSAGALRALRRALTLARDGQRPLSLVVGPGVDAQTRDQARTLLAEGGLEARFVELPRLDGALLVQALRRERPWLLFLARESPLLRGPRGRLLQAELDEAPLVLVP